MYCPNCGFLVLDTDAEYCPHCGSRLLNDADVEKDKVGTNVAGVEPNAAVRSNVDARSNAAVRSSADARSNASANIPSSEHTSLDGRAVYVPGHRRPRVRNANATQAVGAEPTQMASAAPTRKVDAAPTQVADAAPTQVASSAPTQVATAAPTQAATAVPTQAAAAAPTQTAAAQHAAAAQPYGQSYNQPYYPTRSGSTQSFSPVPSPEATPYTSNSKVGNKLPAIVTGVVVGALAVALFATTAAGYGPLAKLMSQQSATTASADSSTSDSSSTSTTTGTESDSSTDGSTADSTSATSNDAASSQDSSATSTDASGTDSTSSQTTSQSDVVSNGNGTVSSTTYGYTMAMPSSFTQTSYDGTKTVYYDSSNDVTITLWGDNNPDGTTVESAYHAAKNSGSSAAYVAHGNSWVVFSDESSSGVVYDMTYYQSGKTCHMEITYPMSSKTAGDTIVNQVQPTFKLTN